MEGTELQRKGNDLVAVVFPSLLRDGQELQLVFRYAGDVLSEAGNGLLYVGERGTWYPNFGLNPAQFDLEFRYPANWTLVATGKPIPAAVAASQPTTDPDQMVSRWVSERPIAVAGFNLGQYTRSEARSGDVLVEAYGTKSLEKSFPKPPPEIVEVRPLSPNPQGPTSVVVLPPPPTPSPAHNTQAVADRAAKAVDHFSRWFGPYPYGSLALTQMPGAVSQGWPGLVFLSSQVFLTTEELNDLHHDSLTAILATQILEHETAHQWWGDLVLWSTYRDQWFSEGLANYSSLLVLEQQNPTQFHQVLDKYRSDLLSKTKNGEQMRDAGPVTLGQRLISSHFPGGYEAISYERGTWMFHMLRCMLRDAEATTHSRNGRTDSEEPFFRSLRKLRDRYAGKTITTRQLIEVFEADLPRPLWYQGHRSLDWFLDGWINGTAMPRLRTRGVRTVEKDRGVVVTGTLEQQDAPDALVTAVPVYAVISGRSPVLIGQVLADGAETSFRLNAPVGTRGVVFDPKETVLTTLK
jgi:Peptidase family M1 domain